MTSLRRATLAPLSDSQLNHRLSIGGPPRAGLAAQKPRQSLAPNSLLASGPVMTGRPSLAGGVASVMAAPGAALNPVNPNRQSISIGRPSVSRMSISASQSAAAGAAMGNSRRSSIMSKPPPEKMKDPRDIRDRGYQQRCIHTLIAFLSEAGYDRPISPKILSAPTAKDFQHIFMFLYHQIDPAYEFQGKIEDEVPVLIRGLRYPFYSDISKSHLFAVGSMHAWPSILAMLTWMVELIFCLDSVSHQSEQKQFESDNAEKLFFAYLSRSYKMFLAGEDNFAALEAELAKIFEKKNETTKKQIDRLTKESEIMTREFAELGNGQSPLEGLEEKKRNLASDTEKFKKFIKTLEGKKTKMLEIIQKTKEDIAERAKEIELAEKERLRLQRILEKQEISAADVEKMNFQMEKLERSLRTFMEQKETLTKVVWEREMVVAKKLQTIEQKVQRYHAYAEKLQLIPLQARFSNGVDYTLRLNVHSSRPEQMLSVNLATTVKPSLVKLKEIFVTKTHEFNSELLQIQEQVDRIDENVAEKSEECLQSENKTKHLEAQFNAEREAINKENQEYAVHMERLERELTMMKNEGNEGIVKHQQHLQGLRMEYDNVCRRTAEEKERYGKALLQVLEELISHKSFVENTLGELCKVAEAEKKVAFAALGN